MGYHQGFKGGCVGVWVSLSFVSHDRCMVSRLGNLFRANLESDESDLGLQGHATGS